MTRTLTTATAIATVLIALAPAADAGQMINVAPQPKVNVAPNVPKVPRPQVNLPAVTPRPDVSRVRESIGPGRPDESDVKPISSDRNGEDDAGVSTQAAGQSLTTERTQALVDHAPIPPAFPETLVKAMDVPPLRPWPEDEPRPLPWLPEEDDEADDGHADHLGDAGEIDTDGSDDDSVGTGNSPPLGQNDADWLREQFRGGVGVEKAEQLARLQELQELGWLEIGLDDAGQDEDCSPGVSAPDVSKLGGGGCGGNGANMEANPTPDRDQAILGGFPLDPHGEADNYPRPSPDDGMDNNKDHDNAWIGGGGSSATGNAGVKDFGVARLRQDSDTDSGDNGKVEVDVHPDGSTTETWKDEDGTVQKVIDRNSSGDPTYEAERNEDGTYFEAAHQATTESGIEMWSYKEVDKPNGNIVGDSGWFFIHPSGSNGGEAGQTDPRGPQTGAGGFARMCLELGIGCIEADKASGKSWGEKMEEWARQIGSGHDMLTPKEAMEQAGQPVPIPWRESGTDKVDDPRSEAGLTPGCDADPGGCGGGAGGTEAAGAAADDALDDAALDTSIAGLTPGCDADPGGCGGHMGAAAEAAVESDAGEAAR